MRREIMLSEAYGLVFEGFVPSNVNGQATLLFDRGQFATIKAMTGYDNDIEIAPSALDLFGFGDRELIVAGILTAEELEERRDKRNRENQTGATAQRRKLYESLKAEFGDE